MKKIIYSLFASLLLGVAGINAQIVTTSPSPLQENSENVEIYFHADQGNKGLIGLTQSDAIYAHTGVEVLTDNGKTESWKYAPSWGNNDAKYQLTYVSPNLWKLYIGDIRTYYGVPATETVKRLCFVFRNADCTLEGKTETKGDIFVDVLDAGFQLSFQSTLTGSIVNAATGPVTFTAGTTEKADITISVNGDAIGNATGATSLTATYTFTSPGEYTVNCKAAKGQTVMEENISVLYVNDSPEATDKTIPANGVTKNADGSYTFCLAAPQKKSVILSGSWNNYAATQEGVMEYVDKLIDGEAFRYFKITMPASVVKSPFSYFYTIDGETKVGDPYALLVLDPEYDRYISESVYPNMPKYPEQFLSSQITMAYYDDNLLNYNWTTTNFKAPDKDNLIIYELLLRDFTGTEGQNNADGTLAKALKKIPYLKELGVNAVELLPIQEFNGNISWGYNTNYYFAPDKAYGSPQQYMRFIDECHANGIAVILDLVFNQADWQHPWYRMYPVGSNPFFNATAPHAYSVLNDWNQGFPMVQEQWKDVLEYWMTEYKFDGFRFDLVKGLGNNDSYANNGDAATNAFNQSRIDRMRELQKIVEAVNPNAYFINENLATPREENAMAETGQLNWANVNEAGCQFAMGYQSDSNLNRMYAPKDGSRLWGSTVSYLESHDEQRLAYKQDQWGVAGVKGNVANSMHRLGSAAAQMILAPGAHMIWQFSELGNYDNTKNSNGGNNTDPKTVRWNLLDDPNRKGLYDNYSELIALRNNNTDLFAESATFENTCAQANWADGRTLVSRAGNKELITVINPNVDKELTVNVSFSSKEESAYQILSKSYNSSPSYSVANGTVTVPANCYVAIGSMEVTAVESVWSDTAASALRIHKEGRSIVVDYAEAPVEIYAADGRKVASLQGNGRVEAGSGVYVVVSGKEKVKIIL